MPAKPTFALANYHRPRALSSRSRAKLTTGLRFSVPATRN